jgi:hypothetical protein
VTTWAEFLNEQPELAEKVRRRFDIRKHKTLATLRSDGSPRISGIEVEFADGQVYLGMMPKSAKLLDVGRDPRLALHSPTEDAPAGAATGWGGEAKISGTAVEVDRGGSDESDGSSFAVDISEVVFTHLNAEGDLLVVEAWHPGRGIQTSQRA